MSTINLFAPYVPSVPPPLPASIPCVSLWEPYASLVIAGIKTIETRTWQWPYPPGWLAIHRAKHVDKSAESRLAKLLAGRGIVYGLPGSVGGLVYVTGCRPLIPADEQAACFYAPNGFGWALKWPRVFARPIVMRGPQKFVYLSRESIEEAL